MLTWIGIGLLALGLILYLTTIPEQNRRSEELKRIMSKGMGVNVALEAKAHFDAPSTSKKVAGYGAISFLIGLIILIISFFI